MCMVSKLRGIMKEIRSMKVYMSLRVRRLGRNFREGNRGVWREEWERRHYAVLFH